MTSPIARVRPVARWVTCDPPNAEIVARLAVETRLPPIVCSLLAVRGHGDPEVAKAYLRPRLEHMHPASLMDGIDRATARIAKAIDSGEVILVHGDYDVDGMCSTTILVQTIRHLGGRAVPFIPHRLHDGYDLSEAGVRAAIEANARVVVTCDCGTSAHGPVASLTAAGIDVIITDHHLPSGSPPDCIAVLNPRLPSCGYPDRDLCAAGVAFKLALALLEARGASVNVALSMLDLVALATVADVVPLRGENRVFARYGMKLMQETRNIGLAALIAASGLEGRRLTAGRIGYILAPRLNAVGRLGHALRGVELLLTRDEALANRLAREFEEINRTRQMVDREILDAARKLTDSLDLDATYGIVLASEGWHSGVIGIVASRLVEEFCRPVVLIAVEGGVGKGSGRSIPAFDLHGGLLACREHLVRFGGHRAAAGLTIDADRLPDFAARFNAVAAERLTPDDLVPEIRVDAVIDLPLANEELERLMRHFEPFGMGNPAPTLASLRATVQGTPRVIGETGLKFCFVAEGSRLEGIWWGAAERAGDYPADTVVDVAYRLEQDTYYETPRTVARLLDVRRSV